MRGATFPAIREWASEGAQLPDRGWSEITDAGFCSLHALAEEEERARGALPAAFWTARSRVAIERGADPLCAELEMNNTPLHWCAWRAAPGCARALLDAGAAARSRNRADESAEDVCRRLLRAEAPSGPRSERMSLLLEMLVASRERETLGRACGPPRAAGRDGSSREGGRL